MSKDCIFCRIVAGEIPATFVHQDDDLVVFRDIQPQAPVHLLVVPRQHIEAVSELEEQHAGVAGRVLVTAAAVARSIPELADGFRLIVNSGPAGGQTVPHLHLHILGGRHFSEGMLRD